jgi:hypothetical protein
MLKLRHLLKTSVLSTLAGVGLLLSVGTAKPVTSLAGEPGQNPAAITPGMPHSGTSGQAFKPATTHLPAG